MTHLNRLGMLTAASILALSISGIGVVFAAGDPDPPSSRNPGPIQQQSPVSKGTKDIYDRIRSQPDWTYIALLFDGKYPVAASLVNRRLTFREYSDAAIFDPALQAVIDKIELIPDLTVGVFGAEATIELADGRKFTSRQDCIANFPAEEKLYTGANGILSRRKIRAIVRAVDRIESFASVRDFVRVASGRTPA